MATGPDRRQFQFSLRTLLELSVVVCLAFSLWAWGGEALSRTPEFFLTLAVLLIAVGVFARRWTWVTGGAVVAIGLICELNFAQTQVNCDSDWGWRTRQLQFRVVDSAGSIPISGATVILTSGDRSRRKLRKTETAVTSADGSCSVTGIIQSREDSYLVLSPHPYEVNPETYDDIEIQIDAVGYAPFHGTLAEYVKSQGPIDLYELFEENQIVLKLSK